MGMNDPHLIQPGLRELAIHPRDVHKGADAFACLVLRPERADE